MWGGSTLQGGRLFDWLDLIRVVLGSGVAGAAVYQLSKGVRRSMVERSRRKTTLAIMDRLIQRERELGQVGPLLEVVRPAPDQLNPPASSPNQSLE